jgi:hypothetical protein
MEKNLETSTKLLPLLKKQIVEHQDSLTTVMENWDKHRVHLAQLGEKVIQLDNWKEDRLTQMMVQLQKESVEKERRPWKRSKQLSKSTWKQGHLPLPLPKPTPSPRQLW